MITESCKLSKSSPLAIGITSNNLSLNRQKKLRRPVKLKARGVISISPVLTIWKLESILSTKGIIVESKRINVCFLGDAECFNKLMRIYKIPAIVRE
jgi:hypothetical protein